MSSVVRLASPTFAAVLQPVASVSVPATAMAPYLFTFEPSSVSVMVAAIPVFGVTPVGNAMPGSVVSSVRLAAWV